MSICSQCAGVSVVLKELEGECFIMSLENFTNSSASHPVHVAISIKRTMVSPWLILWI